MAARAPRCAFAAVFVSAPRAGRNRVAPCPRRGRGGPAGRHALTLAVGVGLAADAGDAKRRPAARRLVLDHARHGDPMTKPATTAPGGTTTQAAAGRRRPRWRWHSQYPAAAVAAERAAAEAAGTVAATTDLVSGKVPGAESVLGSSCRRRAGLTARELGRAQKEVARWVQQTHAWVFVPRGSGNSKRLWWAAYWPSSRPSRRWRSRRDGGGSAAVSTNRRI